MAPTPVRLLIDLDILLGNLTDVAARKPLGDGRNLLNAERFQRGELGYDIEIRMECNMAPA